MFGGFDSTMKQNVLGTVLLRGGQITRYCEMYKLSDFLPMNRPCTL